MCQKLYVEFNLSGNIFLNFGNLHGFKPKFYLSENHIKLKKNFIKNSKIKDLKKIIKKLTISDRFYLDKFEKYRIKFIYY